jgi:hypothetical protein
LRPRLPQKSHEHASSRRKTGWGSVCFVACCTGHWFLPVLVCLVTGHASDSSSLSCFKRPKIIAQTSQKLPRRGQGCELPYIFTSNTAF